MSVDVDDCDHLHKTDDDQSDGASEAVEHFEPIFTGSCSEYQTDSEADDTDDSCNQCQSLRVTM